MCGVFGVIRSEGIEASDIADFEALSQKLRHRGPDGSGAISTERALLGMHRLSIMDVDHGWQPFWSEGGDIGVLGNGEIYNADQLRQGLRARGHQLRTGSDIEVVAHLYEESGVDCVSQLRGMFALVIMDHRTSSVVLIRDRAGEKPLSYVQRNGAFYFSSEQTPLVTAGIVPLRLDDAVVPRYLLHGFVPEPDSIIEGIRKVPAAHLLTVSLNDGSITLSKYWDSLDYAGTEPLSTHDLAGAVEDAVVSACSSDVPIGIALSGGLDSSMIAAIASRVRPDLQAFTIGYGEAGFDEANAAATFASELGIPCHVTTLDTQTVARSFAEVCSMRDEPISDIAGPAIAALPRAAQESGVPVLMTGVGGDELFWGYEWIRNLAAWTTTFTDDGDQMRTAPRWRVTAPPSTRQGAVAWVRSAGGLRTERDLTRFMDQWSTDDSVPLPFYEFQYGYRRVIRAIRALAGVGAGYPEPEFFGSLAASMKAPEYAKASAGSYLLVNGLTQIDRLAMRYSVESRTPFADHKLAETLMSGRMNTLQVFQPAKAQQRAVAKALLPEHVLKRPKRGFTPPVRSWVRAIWRENEQVLTGEASVAVSSLKESQVRRRMKRPISVGGAVDQVALRLATLELWLRGFDQ